MGKLEFPPACHAGDRGFKARQPRQDFKWRITMAKLTISQAMGWKKTLEARLSELQALRNANSADVTVFRGANAAPDKREPVYDVVALDRAINALWRERRRLDDCIKATNATTEVIGYDQDDAVLGELLPAKK